MKFDALDRVVPLHDLPPCDAEAPMPLVMANDQQLLLSYLATNPDPNSDVSYVSPAQLSPPASTLLGAGLIHIGTSSPQTNRDGITKERLQSLRCAQELPVIACGFLLRRK